jgi:hypothetical protein
MKRVRRAVLVVFAVVLVFAVSGSEATAQLPTEDSVSGTAGQASEPGTLPSQTLTNIVVDAHSDPGGANPSGTVSFNVLNTFLVTGPVTCLAVDGNRALVGFFDIGDFRFGPSFVEIVDNESTGLPDTLFGGATGGFTTDCSNPPPPGPFPGGGTVRDGDFVVREAVTTKHQCTDGGWRGYTDEQGQPFFNNQGDCIQFVKRPT